MWFDPAGSIAGTSIIKPNVKFLEETDGLIQVRSVFSLSREQAGLQGARLLLGQIHNFDVAWINGVAVGRTGRDTANAPVIFRNYPIPVGILRPGLNVVVLQIVDWYRFAVFGMNIKQPEIRWPDGESLPLPSEWKMQVVVDLGRRPVPFGEKISNTGSLLFNGMIAPLVPAAFRGVIWYQGESNCSRAGQYRTLFPDMIQAWRAKWNRGPFPFYFVQLANCVGLDGSPELREAQRETLQVPNTGMAVTIDIGDPDNIHPKNKQEVGKRLALWALARTYNINQPNGEPLPYSGPLFREGEIDDGQIRIHFDHTNGGLKVRGATDLVGFAIAGKDGSFLPAQARIDGDVVLVSHPEIPAPRRVRYAWANNPEANLVNGASLPASPFRADLQPPGGDR